MMKLRALLGVVLIGSVAGLAATGQAGAKRAMTFADLMAMKRVSDPQISPSGKWVMFSVTDVDLEKNTTVNHLWVVPLESGGGTPTSQSPDVGHPPSASGQNDTGGGGERQITFGDGETNGRFSPDGKRVSLTTKDQIFEMTWDEAKGTASELIQVTNVDGGADGAVWSPDSKRLMFVGKVYPECSVKVGGPTHRDGAAMNGAPDRIGGTNTAVLRSAQDDGGLEVGGSGEVVKDGAVNAAVGEGFEVAGWAAEDACDNAKDAAAAKSPVKGEVWEGLLYRHWDHYTGAKRSHVLVVDADSGRNLRDLTPATAVGDAETPTFSLGGPLGYAWAPDSKEIAYVTNLDAVPAASTNNDVFTLRLDEVGAKALKVSTSLGSDDGPAYSPDGKWLAWRSQALAGFESDKFRLVVMDRETKAIREATKQWDLWVDEFAWSPDSARLYFASGRGGEEPVYETDVAGSIAGQVAGIVQSGEFGDLRVAPDGESLVMTGMRVDMPAIIVATQVDIPDGRISMLSHLNDAVLDQIELFPMESFEFAGAGGTKVQGFVLRPPNFDPGKKYPVKFLMHGGPQTAWGDSWSYRWNWELMAASGYVVIGINRRGSTGYGQKFVDEVSGDWGGRAYVDLMRGLDYAEAKYSFIDKTRECALGASYGGFMADWVLTHTNRFKCIVTHDGMYDPESAWGTTEEMWFNEWEFRRPEDFPKGWDGFGGGKGVTIGQSEAGHPAEPWRYASLAADQDPFRKWSPMRFIQNAKTPTLVIHSQKDYRLDVSQGFALFTALQRLGVPSKMLYFPDEGHWVLKPQNAELWNAVVGDWCDRWTKSGKYAEVGAGR
jgi:dipeptidyl aminopeptidase/acylaminoacyl peptidase